MYTLQLSNFHKTWIWLISHTKFEPPHYALFRSLVFENRIRALLLLILRTGVFFSISKLTTIRASHDVVLMLLNRLSHGFNEILTTRLTVPFGGIISYFSTTLFPHPTAYSSCARKNRAMRQGPDVGKKTLSSMSWPKCYRCPAQSPANSTRRPSFVSPWATWSCEISHSTASPYGRRRIRPSTRFSKVSWND